MIYDVIIIGAGVTGSAVARELSRYELKTAVLEKCEDVCCGTSKANSGIVHAGYDCRPGSLMAAMNVRGNEMMGQLAKDLDIPFKREGSLVVCSDPDETPHLQELYERGAANGVPGLRILNREEALELEPNLADEVVAALFAPTAGIVCPFRLNTALAENANRNGTEFYFQREVTGLDCDEQGIWHIHTDEEEYQSRYVVNAAGVYADVFHNMVSSRKIHITARRGEYFLLDKTAGGFVRHTVFQLPTKFGKGVLVTPTVHGNVLVGPTAEDVDDKENTATTAQGMDSLSAKSALSMKNIPLRQVITSFAGLRAHEDGHEFILGEVPDAPGFIDCAGIESPGLSSCPAIGEYTAELLRQKLNPAVKTDWIATERDVLHPSDLSLEERNALIREKPAYGTIICRCESISEGEILDAIHRPLGAKSLDGVKRRTRAGMGRCQAGFCSPKVMEILHRELGLPMEKITKNGGGSGIVRFRTKEES